MSAPPLISTPDGGGGGSGNATQLQGYAIAATAPTTGQFLGWNGTNWVSSPSGSTSLNGMNYPSSTGVTVGSIAYVSAANTASYLAAGAAGTVFQGTGATSAPSWSTNLSLSGGQITLASVQALNGGSTFLTIGNLAYTAQMGFVVGNGGTFQFVHNNLTSLTVSRATNDVSILTDAAASSLTIGMTATAGAGAGLTIRAQASTGAGGVGGTLRLGGGLGGSGTGNAGPTQIDALSLTSATVSVAGGSTHALSPTESLNSVMSFTGVLTADVAVTTQFGPASGVYWLLNNTSGGFALTFGGTTGKRVYLPNGVWTMAVCDDVGSNFYTNTRTFEILLTASTVNAVGTASGPICKLPPNAVLTIANIRTTTALVGGTTTISLGIAANGVTVLKALTPPAVGALPLGVNTSDLGTDMLSTSGYQAYYAAAATIYGTQVQSTAACTAGATEIYLAGYVP